MLTSQTTLSGIKTNLYGGFHQGATLGSQDGNKSRTCCAGTLVQEVSLSYHMHTCIHDGLTPSIQCLCSRKQLLTLLDPLLAATIIPPLQQTNASSPPVYFSFFPLPQTKLIIPSPPQCTEEFQQRLGNVFENLLRVSGISPNGVAWELCPVLKMSNQYPQRKGG